MKLVLLVFAVGIFASAEAQFDLRALFNANAGSQATAKLAQQAISLFANNFNPAKLAAQAFGNFLRTYNSAYETPQQAGQALENFLKSLSGIEKEVAQYFYSFFAANFASHSEAAKLAGRAFENYLKTYNQAYNTPDTAAQAMENFLNHLGGLENKVSVESVENDLEANAVSPEAVKVAEALQTGVKMFADFQTTYNKVYETPQQAGQAQENFLKNCMGFEKKSADLFAQGPIALNAEATTAELAQQAETLFSKNYESLDDINKKFEDGIISYQVGVNEFFDRDLPSTANDLCGTVVPGELVDELTVLKQAEETRRRRKRDTEISASRDQLTSVDVETKTPPKPSTFPAAPPLNDFMNQLQPIVNQDACGACWSFASMAQVEALYSRKSSSYKVSEQLALDCTEDTKGCDGGWPKRVLDHILVNGTTLSDAYPYKNKKETCQKPTEALPRPGTESYQYVLKGNEKYLTNILAAEGPIVVVIHAPEIFIKYKKGFFDDLSCNNDCKKVNHAMLLIGYGTDSVTGKDYYLLRNSWGTTWGENGYIKLFRDNSNHCGVACYAMYLKNP